MLLRLLFMPGTIALGAASPPEGAGGWRMIAARLQRYAPLALQPLRHARLRAAVAAPAFAGIRRRQPQLTIKYLHSRYLLRGLDTEARAAIFTHHYGVLARGLAADRLCGLLDDGLLLWSAESEAGQHAITLQFSDPTDNEGELTLSYRLDRSPVAVLSFSFAPGPSLDAEAGTVLLVSRLQRAKGCGDAFKAATRSQRGLAPPVALVAALGGWAAELGVTEVVGVSAARQVCIEDGEAAAFHAAYDDFFAALGASEAAGLFTLSLPPAEKPLSAVKPGNRPRTKQQRELKRQIAMAARDAASAPPATDAVRWGVPDRVAAPGSHPAQGGATVLVFLSAFAQERDGSQARAAALLDRLVAERREVIVYSHEDHDASPWTAEAQRAFRARWPGVELALERQSRALGIAAGLKNLAVSLYPTAAARLLGLRLPALSPVWDAVRDRAGLCVVNYKSALSQLNGIDVATCFVETHDLMWLKWAKLADASPISVAALRRLRGEIATLDATRGVLAISPAEAGFFRMLLARAPTFYVSAWAGAGRSAEPWPAAEPAFDLVFVGSAYEMNVRGFCAALERDAGWLARYRIAVCGRICEDPAIRRTAERHPSVTLLGFVEDLRPLYARSKAALVPVDGTGLKMKLVSALEAGLPALAVPQVFEGLPAGHEDAVFPLDEAAATALLDDPARLAAARIAAARYYARFTAAGEADQAIAAMAAVLPIRPVAAASLPVETSRAIETELAPAEA